MFSNRAIDPRTATIESGKKWLRSRLAAGARCPLCNQLARIYERKLYSSIAAALVHVFSKFGDEYVHKSQLVSHPTLATTFGGGDFAKLSYWGLIEEKPKEDGKDSRTSGMWRITELGRQFAGGKVTVKSHVRLYDGKFLGFGGVDVTVHDCLGEKFSYDELMGGLK